jgi:hypothetical protein
MNLAGDAAARDDAMELARDLAHGAAMPNRDRTGKCDVAGCSRLVHTSLEPLKMLDD